MTAQRALLVVAIAAGLVSGALYYAGSQRTTVVVAATDLVPGRAITAADLETRSLPPDALPAGAISDPAAALGRFLRSPLWKGQLVLASAVAGSPAAFDGGIELPTGYRAIAIPVNAGQAVGGALIPGARVDVIAVPIQGKAPAGRATELLASATLVLDVRGEQGAEFEPHPAARQQATAVRDRLGSVVVAVGAQAAMTIADRIPTSTFVLALVRDHP